MINIETGRTQKVKIPSCTLGILSQNPCQGTTVPWLEKLSFTQLAQWAYTTGLTVTEYLTKYCVSVVLRTNNQLQF